MAMHRQRVMKRHSQESNFKVNECEKGGGFGLNDLDDSWLWKCNEIMENGSKVIEFDVLCN